MSFLRTAFWVIIAVALALFAKANWAVAPTYSGYVPVKLWDDIILETRLPVLILGAFLLGLIPTWLWARAMKWQMKRKLASTERALASSTAAPVSPEPPVQASSPTPSTPSTDSLLPKSSEL